MYHLTWHCLPFGLWIGSLLCLPFCWPSYHLTYLFAYWLAHQLAYHSGNVLAYRLAYHLACLLVYQFLQFVYASYHKYILLIAAAICLAFDLVVLTDLFLIRMTILDDLFRVTPFINCSAVLLSVYSFWLCHHSGPSRRFKRLCELFQSMLMSVNRGPATARRISSDLASNSSSSSYNSMDRMSPTPPDDVRSMGPFFYNNGQLLGHNARLPSLPLTLCSPIW